MVDEYWTEVFFFLQFSIVVGTHAYQIPSTLNSKLSTSQRHSKNAAGVLT